MSPEWTPEQRDVADKALAEMAKEFDWREVKSYMPSDEECCVCGSKWRIGMEPRFLYNVCEEHSTMSPVQISELEWGY